MGLLYLYLYLSKQTLLQRWLQEEGCGGRVTNGRLLTNIVTFVCVARGAFMAH